jgi:ethanolamine transporter EutH
MNKNPWEWEDRIDCYGAYILCMIGIAAAGCALVDVLSHVVAKCVQS